MALALAPCSGVRARGCGTLAAATHWLGAGCLALAGTACSVLRAHDVLIASPTVASLPALGTSVVNPVFQRLLCGKIPMGGMLGCAYGNC